MGKRRYEPEFPKPFDFVEFASKVSKKSRPGHDSLHTGDYLSGELHYTMTVETLLHVSSGNYALTEDLGIQAKNIVRDVYKVTVKGETLPAVPGSTLKGAARAIVEAVTESCIGVTRVNRQELPSTLRAACRPPLLCPACGLFGAMNRQSRLRFSDAVLVEGEAVIARMPALYGPRPWLGRDYKNRARQFKGRKFYFHGRPQPHNQGTYVEALKPGAVLAGSVAFTNLEPAELGLLLFALGLDSNFQLALGGGKPVAMGRVKLMAAADTLHLHRTESFLDFDAGAETQRGEALQATITTYIAAAESLILADQRAQLRKILDPANERPAPTGVY